MENLLSETARTGRYTIIDDPAVNALIGRVIDETSRRLRDLLGDRMTSLFLVGSYARGEGSVRSNQGAPHLISDFDFLAVLRPMTLLREQWIRRRIEPLVKTQCEAIAKRHGVVGIDVLMWNENRLRNANPHAIEPFEIREAHYQISGDHNPCSLMPVADSSLIDLREGVRLFRNRGNALLLAAHCFFNPPPAFNEYYLDLIKESNKAMIAAGDFCLLQRHLYRTSYRRRLETARELMSTTASGAETEILRTYVKALSDKLMPPDDHDGDRASLRAYWREARNVLLASFFSFECARFGNHFDGWLAYAAHPKHGSAVALKALMARILRGGEWRQAFRLRSLEEEAALVALLLASYDLNALDDSMFSMAAERAGSVEPAQSATDDSWRRLTSRYLLEWKDSPYMRKILKEESE